MTDVDVLIVGGGWTGTSAAMALHAHAQANPGEAATFALLEGHPDRLGGRAFSFPHTWKDADGNEHTTHFEHGAQYIGQDQEAIWGLVQEAIAQGLIDEDALVDGFAARFPYKAQVMMVAGQRYQYDRDRCLFGIGGVPPDLDLWDLLGSLVFIQAVEIYEQAINVLEPWKSPKFVTDLDAMTMDQWIDGFQLPPGAASLMKVSVEAVLSVQTDEVSAFYFLWYCACNGGFLNEVNDEEGGPQQYYLSCGMDGLIDALVAPFRDQIHFGEVVQSVTQTPDGVTVKTSQGTHTAKKVIFATSPASAKKVAFEPALPEAWQKITSQTMGTTTKCVIYYRTPWWRNTEAQADKAKEGVPQYTGYCGANDYPVIWVMDYSPVGPAPEYADQGCYALMTFTIGDEAKQLAEESGPDAVAKWVTTAVADLMNDSRALWTSDQYLGVDSFEWSASTPLIPGGPNTVFMPGILTGESGAPAPAESFDQPVGDLHFACSELARKRLSERKSPFPSYLPNWKDFTGPGIYSDWREDVGYMDGAITCGRFVAEQVLVALGKAKEASAGKRIVGWAEELVAEAEAAIENWLVGPPEKPPLVEEAQVLAVLSTFCQSLYQGSALDIPKWRAERWQNDAAALQNWVTETLVDALVQNDLLPAPPATPSSGGVATAITYLEAMAKWASELLTVATGFTRSGYQLYSAFEPSRNPYTKPQAVSDVVQMTRLANALMQLKSVEPYHPGGDAGPTRGRFMSLSRGVKARGA